MSLIVNPPTPCRIGKRAPAPKNRPAIEESRGGGHRVEGMLQYTGMPHAAATQETNKRAAIKNKTKN